MTYSDRIAAMDMSPVEGVTFTLTGERSQPQPEMPVFECRTADDTFAVRIVFSAYLSADRLQAEKVKVARLLNKIGQSRCARPNQKT